MYVIKHCLCLLNSPHLQFYATLLIWFQFNSVQFSHSVVPNSLRPHELQHASPPCPSPSPGVEPEIKLPTSAGSSKKQESSRKNIYFCFTDYAKAFDYVDHNKLWKILKEMGIPRHLTCLLRNLYAGQEATVRTGHGITDSFPNR